MKIALVHELLTMKGGAERVLRIVSEMFPEAPIFTLLYDEEKLGDWFPRERVHPSRLQKIAQRSKLRAFSFNHHLYLSRFPSAVEQWPFDPSTELRTCSAQGDTHFDLVLSFSSAFVHGIITNGAPRHLCYVHSPARYLWDQSHDVLERAGKGFLGPLRRAYLKRVFHRLRIWDGEAADRPDMLLAASREVERRIELYWRRESTVLTPPVDDLFLEPRKHMHEQMEHPDSFLIVSTLAPYKRIDLAIEAANAIGVHLKIIGEGPDRKRLERMAGPTIKFYGYRGVDELCDLYATARATIFPGEEDFGLVPLESMASGTPVIAYRAGGALETVIENETGIFFDEPAAVALASAMTKMQSISFDRERCRAQARRFSRKRFEEGLRMHIENIMHE